MYRKYLLFSFLIFFLLKNIHSQTILNKGDLAIVAVNANLASSGTLNTKDEISFVCFKPITTGTEIQILDAGYENCLAGLWSCGQEGGAKFTRTGPTIAAGTVITFRNTSPYTFLSPDNGWVVTDLYVHPTNTNYSVLANDFNINSGGDQIYFAQGGTWSELSTLCTINGSRTSPNATFPGNNGRILFGFSTSNLGWSSFMQSSGESGLYPGTICFSMAPTNGAAYNKYTGPLSAANQTTWISRISNTTNWTSYSSSTLYASSSPNYSAGLTLTINSGGDIPTATWTAPSGTICSNTSAINLTNLITGTTGGTWSGIGVSGNLFNPSGLNGSYEITYTVNYISGTSSCPISQTNLITVNATPSAPTVTTPVTYCQNATATALIASGTNLLWYTTATGGTGSATAPTPTTTTAGNTTYYVSQTSGACESPRANIVVTVNANPAAPTVTTPISYCQNATANTLIASGINLLWYTAATGGTGSATAPTPTTTTAGNTTYYVSQTSGACESPRANIVVTVNANPAAPTVTTPISYCQNATANTLIASGTNLLWYTTATGGTGSATAPTPNTTTSGNTNYYVSQTILNCESPRANIVVTVNAIPTLNPIANQTICGNNLTNAIIFSGLGIASYNWTNSNTSIGMAASGTGNIASFTALNNGTTPVTASITATPVSSANAYIANSWSNTVSVINTATNTVTALISVGSFPYGVAVSPDGTKAYVTNGGFNSNSLSVINTATNTVTATIPVGSEAKGVAVSPDGTKVYVANYASNSVSVINTATNTVTATIPIWTGPMGIAVSPDGTKVYVTNAGNNSNSVSVINTATNTVTSIILVAADPYGVAVSPDGTKVYVANNSSNSVSVINTASNIVTATASVGIKPEGISVSPDGTKVYVANSYSNSVSVINTSTNNVIATIPVGSYAKGISITSDGALVYVTNNSSSSVSVINTASNIVTTTIQVGNSPVSFGNFISSASGCTGTPITFTITVNPTPTATISYTGSPFCATGTVSPTITGTTGGTFSSTTGLSINTTTGVINLATSTAGTYMVTYAATSGGCNFTTTCSVTINAAPTINAVSNQTVCTNTSTAPINFSGIGTNIFNWTNNNTVIGLAASGTGNIASFTALNSGTVPITATITATPVPSSFAYIANYGSITSFPLSNTVTVINTNTNAIAGTITVGSNPFGVSASSDGTKVYVTNYGANSVSVINTSTNTVVNTINVGSQPMGIVVSPDGSRVYVANQLSNTLSVINTGTNTVVATIPISLQPQGVAISPDGSKVYVANVNSNNISVINTATNTVITTIGVGTQPITAAISPDGSRLYVTNFGSNNISIINTSTNSVITSVPVGFAPNGIAVTPDGMKVYVTNQLSGNVSIINTATNTVSGTISVGSNPQGISFTADGSKAFVANFGSNNVSVINTATNAVTTNVGVGFAPHSLGNFISQSGICTGVPTTFTITVNPLPVATFSYPANTYCTLGTATPTITGTSGGTFSSSNGLIINATSGVINLAASTPGIYTITYTLTVGNCTITPTATITINAIPNAPIVTTPIAYCQNATATALTATGTNLLWYNLPNGSIGTSTSPIPSTTFIGSSNYYVTQTINNCESPQATIIVNVVSAPTTPIINPTGPIQICADSSVILYSSASTDNEWYKDGILISGGTSNSLQITEAGNYTVKVSNSNGCSSISSGVSIILLTNPIVSIGPDKSVFEGDSVQLISTVSGGNLFNYLWTPSQYLSDNIIANPWVINPLSDMLYKLTVINENGCRASNTVNVKLLKDLKIPNVFSPNGDGLHDYWDITNLDLFPNATVQIFNRNGQIIFQSKGYAIPWDGKKNGIPVPIGVYYYIINTGNNKPIKSGWLTVLR